MMNKKDIKILLVYALLLYDMKMCNLLSNTQKKIKEMCALPIMGRVLHIGVLTAHLNIVATSNVCETLNIGE